MNKRKIKKNRYKDLTKGEMKSIIKSQKEFIITLIEALETQLEKQARQEAIAKRDFEILSKMTRENEELKKNQNIFSKIKTHLTSCN